jgi:hypothetical protein
VRADGVKQLGAVHLCETRIDLPHPLDCSRPLPGVEVGSPRLSSLDLLRPLVVPAGPWLDHGKNQPRGVLTAEMHCVVRNRGAEIGVHRLI